MALVPRERRPHRRNLARVARLVDAAAEADPSRRRAAIEGGVDRRRDGGVADSHLTDGKDIRPAGDRLHAECHGGNAGPLVHGCVVHDVGGGDVESEIEGLEAEVVGGADLVDRGAAGREILEHLSVDLWGVSRDAARRDPVACGKDADERAVDRRDRLALPRGKPFDQPFEPAQAPGRLGQLAIARPHCPDGGFVRPRHLVEQAANVRERGRAGAHLHGYSWLLCSAERQGRPIRGHATLVKRAMPLKPFAEDALRQLAAGGRNFLSDLLRCLRFYSRLPVPVLASEIEPYGAPDFATMPRAVPLAGAIIGAVGALVLAGGHTLGLGAWLCAAFAVASLTLATGAFHEDGLADAADGLGGGATPERRLEIMKDSRIGSFGGAALILAYLLRIGCLAEILARTDPFSAAAALIVVAALSRTAGLVLMTLLPPARVTGSSYVAGQPAAGIVATAWLICGALAVIAGIVAPLPWPGLLLAFVFAGGVAVAMTRLSARLIGGQTGDVGGAIQQLAEIAAYLGLLIAARP